AATRFDALSGGERQRLALALALVNDPRVVILDEPTAGLDPAARQELHAAILALKRDGRTVLLTTHYLEEAEKLCDRVAIIHEGRIVASGAPGRLLAEASAFHRVALVATRALDRDGLAALPQVMDLVVAGNTARFRTARPAAVLAEIAAWLNARQIELVDLEVRKASLEEVFLALTREGER